MESILAFFEDLDFATKLVLAAIMILVGGFWTLFAAYREDVSWGRLIFCVPAFAIFFCVLHPLKGILPLILQLCGIALFVSTFISLFSGQSHFP